MLLNKDTKQKVEDFLGNDRKLLCFMRFGSHLYGTDTTKSDLDTKGIYLPSKKDYLLGNVPKTFHADTNNTSTKNTQEDIDVELFSLNYFVELACQGQTCVFDMLFCNEKNLIEGSNIWSILVAMRDKFFQKDLRAFVGYAQKQAAKYGIKGSRLNAAKETLDVMKEGNTNSTIKLSTLWDKLPVNEHCFFKTEESKQGVQEFYNMCGKKLQETITVEYAQDIVQRFYNAYGARAQSAALNENVDWKAISHAIRACFQLEELYTTREIVFPLKDAEYILKVKQGLLDYKSVAEVLEDKITAIHDLSEKSTFPEKVDRSFWNAWLYSTLNNTLMD